LRQDTFFADQDKKCFNFQSEQIFKFKVGKNGKEKKCFEQRLKVFLSWLPAPEAKKKRRFFFNLKF
jgi:hypothetical protein